MRWPDKPADGTVHALALCSTRVPRATRRALAKLPPHRLPDYEAVRDRIHPPAPTPQEGPVNAHEPIPNRIILTRKEERHLITRLTDSLMNMGGDTSAYGNGGSPGDGDV